VPFWEILTNYFDSSNLGRFLTFDFRKTADYPAENREFLAQEIDFTGKRSGMEQFGDALRMERERRQVSLESICEVTKVSLHHLEALEAGRYADLPGGVFRKGILRSYLKAVGLEESGWVEQFENAVRTIASETEEEGWTEFAENVRRSRAGSASPGIDSRWLGVAAMILGLAALGWSVWRFVFHGRLFL